MIRVVIQAILVALFALPAAAQQWPAKPVKFIVPYPPGGTVDPLARLLGAKLQASLGQPFVVENRPGAGGAIGTAPYAIATLASKPYSNFGDVLKAAKANPGAVSVGSIGNGTLAHLILVLAQQSGGFKINHIPFKGGGPMTQAVLGGQVELGIGSAALLSPQVKAGKMRVVAVTGNKRSPSLPDAGTLAEQGVAGVVVNAWWGIVAPAGTPKPIIDRFHAELTKALNLPDVRKVLSEGIGMELLVSTPEQMDKFVAAEVARWSKVIKENGIRPD